MYQNDLILKKAVNFKFYDVTARHSCNKYIAQYLEQ